MNQWIERLVRSLPPRKTRLPFPNGQQVFLFNKRPILYKDFTQTSLQEAIHELQSLLISKGLLTTVTGKFDVKTEAAIKQFQRENQLFVDGVVGPLTWSCLRYPRLSRQDKAFAPAAQIAIREIQSILQQEGLLHHAPTGQFDRATERAIRRFQKLYGLRDDGIVGAATWAMLLGMRQRSENSQRTIYLLPLHWLPVWEQMLMITCILLGIYYSPLPGTTPHFKAALTTAYGLAYVVPFLLDRLPLRPPDRPDLRFVQYAPYVLTGIFWKPLIQVVEKWILTWNH